MIPRGDTTYATGGSPNQAEALHRTWAAVGEDGIRRVTGGPAFAMVVSLADSTLEAWSLLPFGSSEDPHSPHFADQAAMQATGSLKPAWFRMGDVALHVESVTTVPFGEQEAAVERDRAFWRVRLREMAVSAEADGGETEGEPE